MTRQAKEHIEVCPDCGEEIRYLEVIGCHAETCQTLRDPEAEPTDAERAADLAQYFQSMATEWPEAAETARLLKAAKFS